MGTDSAATMPNDTNPPNILSIFICESPQFNFRAELRAGAEYSRTTLIWFRRQENAEVIAFVDEGSEAGVAGEADRQARS